MASISQALAGAAAMRQAADTKDGCQKLLVGPCCGPIVGWTAKMTIAVEGRRMPLAVRLWKCAKVMWPDAADAADADADAADVDVMLMLISRVCHFLPLSVTWILSPACYHVVFNILPPGVCRFSVTL